jgi:hypothetical protein
VWLSGSQAVGHGWQILVCEWHHNQVSMVNKSRCIPRLLGFHGYDTASFMASQPGLPWLGVHGKQMKIQNQLTAAVRQWATGSINVWFVSNVQRCRSWRASRPYVRSVHTLYINERFRTFSSCARLQNCFHNRNILWHAVNSCCRVAHETRINVA